MKMIHLADLHIGKRVNEFSMIEDQDYILKRILEIVEEQKVEGVLIAGDVYDKPIPSAEAVCLLDQFLTRLAGLDLPVFLISGNHDSPERLAFGGNLLESRKIHVSPVFDGTVKEVILTDEYGEIGVYLCPFLKPSIVRRYYEENEITTYQDALQTVLDEIPLKEERRNILVCHQFVTGGSRSDSEEQQVGGVDNVDAAIFDRFDYVALGHLHGPQHMGREQVRYAGSPLKYSFSETRQKKAAVIVDVKEKGCIEITHIPLIPRRDMEEIKGTYLELTNRAFYEEKNLENYYHITLTDEEDVPDAVGKLRVIYPNLMRVDYDNGRTRAGETLLQIEEMERKSPFQLLEDFYEQQNHMELNEAQKTFAKELIERIAQGGQE